MIGEFQKLDEVAKKVILATTEEMGGGMASFVGSKIFAMETKEMYYRYTRYVAGILGDGLTKLFVLAGVESDFWQNKKLSFFSENFSLFSVF